ncbi:hypothetical protein JMJ55_29485 [Belnapia sp. T6]|uniref:Uncharacterized protein n=1 Tax=Belnapia mucosa TaxID=2804532 RepID=A0ABS1VCP6_9PROT|nr:hypothetical protein [Belnapia mucosa]MBL6459449.1 hypothetical protein [Belnapia mucosa]
MGETISFVGLVVHKATIAVCVAEAGRDGEVRFVGKLPNEPAALDKLVARLDVSLPPASGDGTNNGISLCPRR